MTEPRRTFAACAVVASLAVGAAPTGAEEPVPTDPTSATQILRPSSATIEEGAVSYTVQVATAGAYSLDLYCGGSFRATRPLFASEAEQRFRGRFGTVFPDERCFLQLYGYDPAATGSDTAQLDGVAVIPVIRAAAARPGRFYPRVRDGFRDRTAIAFRSRLDSDAVVKIVSRATGSVVRVVTRKGRGRMTYYGRRAVAWNGRDRTGDVVAAGRYRAVITSTLNGRSAKARVILRVRSGR